MYLVDSHIKPLKIKTMKNYLLKTVLVFSAILFIPSLMATGQVIMIDSAETERKENFRKNVIKINLSSLALNNYNFNFERSLTRKISLVAGYRYMPATFLDDLPVSSTVIDRFSQDDDEFSNNLSAVSAGNQSITGEVRFYGGKHAGARGFYLSLYGRQMSMDVNYLMDYDTETRAYQLPIKSNLKGFGGGLMIGAQWLIAKRVTFDWYILGAHYGNLKGNANIISDLSSMTEQEKIDLQEELESLIEFGNTRYISANVNNQGAIGKVKGPFAGVRGLGFSLGLAF
jgi:hypothetical protein